MKFNLGFALLVNMDSLGTMTGVLVLADVLVLVRIVGVTFEVGMRPQSTFSGKSHSFLKWFHKVP